MKERQCLSSKPMQCQICDAPENRIPLKQAQIRLVSGRRWVELVCIPCLVGFVWKYLPVCCIDAGS